MKTRFLQLLLVTAVLFSACNDKYKDLKDGLYADIETDKGTIILELYAKDVPMTVSNFVSLAEGTNTKVDSTFQGKKYYDGMKFHRVMKDFMIQGGDPLANGTGGPGYTFPDEFPRDSTGQLIYKHDGAGVLSMANPGKNANGSQFFITHKATPWLDGVHSIFGKLITGQDVVDSIAQNDVIKSVKIVRRGAEAKGFDANKVFVEETEKAAQRIAEDEKKRLEIFEKNKEAFYKKQGVDKAVKQESGLQILTLKKGKGKKFSKDKPATMDYSIYLADGKLIQSSVGQTPFTFTLSKRPLITGVTEAIMKMRQGGKVRLFIPYYLAYGENGGGPFPPKADVVFEFELLKVE